MKSMKKSLFIIGLLVLALSGSAWSESLENHVKLSPSGEGDVLIFPFYYADQAGSQTKITVMNTSDTECIVAKLIVREGQYSREILDFLLYLSPRDIWTGTIHMKTGSNLPWVTSTDPSAISLAALTGSTVQCVAPCNLTYFDTGYVEVIGAWAANLGPRPVTKSAIKTAYDTQRTAGTRGNVINDRYNFIANPPDIYAGYPNPLRTRSNILAGFYQVQNVVTGTAVASGGNRAIALKDYQNTDYLSVGTETFIGQGAQNTTGEVEAALAKTEFSYPYVKSANAAITYLAVLFPTKYFSCTNVRTVGISGPFWVTGPGAAGSIQYQLFAYDMEEVLDTKILPDFSPLPPGPTPFSFPYELNFINSSTFPFAEGQAVVKLPMGTTDIGTTLTFPADDDFRYAGTPAIGVVANVGIKDGRYISMEVFDPAYSEGEVEVDTDADGNYWEIMDYQYSDSGVKPFVQAPKTVATYPGE